MKMGWLGWAPVPVGRTMEVPLRLGVTAGPDGTEAEMVEVWLATLAEGEPDMVTVLTR